MLRVFVISPLPAVRAGLRALLEQSGDLTVVGEASHLRPRLEPDVPAGASVDVVVLDSPATPDAAEELAEVLAGPLAEAGLVVLGSPVDRSAAAWSLGPDHAPLAPLHVVPPRYLWGPRGGAAEVRSRRWPQPVAPSGQGWAYLGREASAEKIVAAVRAVASGLVAIDPCAGGYLLSRNGARSTDDDLSSGGERGATEEVTAREREVLQLVAVGLPNKHIARRLAISEHTVKFHVAALLAKLGAGSRTEAVHRSARRGLIAL